MKYFMILFALLSTDSAMATEASWSCGYEVVEGGNSEIVQIQNFIGSEMGVSRKAISTPRGPIMAEVQLVPNDKNEIELMPKLRYGADRMPSASMPAEKTVSKNGNFHFEAKLKISEVKDHPALDVRLLCEQSRQK